MGKPFAEELDQVPATYRWALTQRLDKRLLKAVASMADLPLLAVGSGGSFSCADLVASLHRDHARKISTPMTPLATAAAGVDLHQTALVLLTAGGKNPDVLGLFQNAVLREPRRFLVFCTTQGSPLAKMAARHAFVDVVETSLPTGKDGFLATNSLIATSVFFARAYEEVFSTPLSLPASWSELLEPPPDGREQKKLDDLCSPLWERETLLVLHGPDTTAAAIDLESKFCEASLGNVQIADYRHFAHGRHHWLAKRAERSALIAFVTPTDESVAAQTIRLIPKKVSTLRLDIPWTGTVANLAALGHVLAIVQSAGISRGIDPGRPKVPSFGRRIYHLRPLEYERTPLANLPLSVLAPISRKAKTPPSALAVGPLLSFWQDSLSSVLSKLQSATFKGIVLDYDGTLCDERAREQPIAQELAAELSRLLEAGVAVGIATGRGKSVRKDLQKSLDAKFWKKVIVGYYNGADIGFLSDNSLPDGTERVGKALEAVAAALTSNPPLMNLATLEPRPSQITVSPKQPGTSDEIWNVLAQVVNHTDTPGVSVLRSSHSLDVLAPEVTKMSVVRRVAAEIDDDAPILCIGDRGQWPGNDHSLLSQPFSLSVDEVSADPSTCWNLAPPGTRGPQAALEYLKSLRPTRGGVRLRLKGFSRREP